MQAPAGCAFSVGKTSQSYAPNLDDNAVDSVSLDIKLPGKTNGQQLKLFKSDFYGNVTTNTITYDSNAGYQTTLSEGDLLILKK